MKRRLYLIFMLQALAEMSLACPVCEKQQPAVLRGITHGAGPQSNWDWVIVILISLLALLSLFFSIKMLLKPGESNQRHIKRSILETL